MVYDSTADMLKHIHRVQELMYQCIERLRQRAADHDQSKLSGVEKEAYDFCGERLRDVTYGTPEYFAPFNHPLMKRGLAHHFAHNSHHAEHYPNGINDMSLFDVLEMVVDWKAASERHADGDITKSLLVNQKRYGVSDQLMGIIRNTYRELGITLSDKLAAEPPREVL